MELMLYLLDENLQTYPLSSGQLFVYLSDIEVACGLYDFRFSFLVTDIYFSSFLWYNLHIHESEWHYYYLFYHMFTVKTNQEFFSCSIFWLVIKVDKWQL